MHASKISVISMVPMLLAGLLTGCLDVFDDEDSYSPVTVAPVPAPAPVVSPTPAATPSADGACCHPTASFSEPVCEWHPLEGHLVRAGDLVMDLKRKMGKDPSHREMLTHIQSNMGLTAAQAEKVLEELGL